MDDLVKRASVKLRSLVKLRDAGADTTQLVQVYIARVRSTVEYAAQVYDPLINASQVSKIEHVQFRAAQIILGPRSRSYAKNMEQLGLVTLAERRAELVRNFAIATYRSPIHRWWYVPHPPTLLNTRLVPPRFFVPTMTNVDRRPIVAYTKVLND